MKTIQVVYSRNPAIPEEQRESLKKYSFNTSADLMVGDALRTMQYDSFLIVAKVHDELFKYYNPITGELSNEPSSPNQREIRWLVYDPDYANKVLFDIFTDTKQ